MTDVFDFFDHDRKKHQDRWHYDPAAKIDDAIFVANIFDRFPDSFVDTVKKEYEKPESRFDWDATNSSVYEDTYAYGSIKQALELGIPVESTKNDTIFNHTLPENCQFFEELCGLDPCRILVNRQRPGNFLPWHIDKNPKFIQENEYCVRYTVFLEDWYWGHSLLIGNTQIHQWKAGDLYIWPSYVWHCSANLGFKNKILLHAYGIDTEQSLHRKLNVSTPWFS